MPDAEITVQYLGTNKKNAKFGFIRSAEGTNYGCLAEQLKQFSTGQVYKIRYHTNDRGYAEFDAILTAPPVKQNTRPVTAPREARQIGVLACSKIFEPIPTENIDEMRARGNRVMIVAAELYDRHLGGQQVQARDDMNDEITF